MIDDSPPIKASAQKTLVKAPIQDVVRDNSDDENYPRRLVNLRGKEVARQADEEQNQQRRIQKFFHVSPPLAFL